MPFVKHRGLPGLVFVPPVGRHPRRHRCPDCLMCQMCSEDRCRVCRKRCACRSKRR